jgi:dTDP-4-dehydrorhamnose reductase
VVITGGAGQLASDLEIQLETQGHNVQRLARAELDVTDDAGVAARLSPDADLVFNCAAFHNVEECETEEKQAAAVNVRAVKRLAERCAEIDASLVHFSTNYVFDGTADDPYREDDLPNPRSVYAITKLAGEHAALAYAPRALVVRTAGLYGLAGSAAKGGNFVQRMAGRAKAGEAIKMVADQRLAPTFTADLAASVAEAVAAGATGLMHLTNAGECSWHEFTQAIMELIGVDVEVEPVKTTRPPGGADRPLNGVLALDAADRLGLAPPRNWRAALADYVDRAEL